MIPPRNLYEEDLYEWVQEQLQLIRYGPADELDFPHIYEELADVGANLYHALSSAVYQVLVHLLKWRYQPERRSKSWRLSLVEHRNRIARRAQQSPSLARQVDVMIKEEYPGACRKASVQTELPLDTFPSFCPWTVEQICDHDFFPE